MFRQKLQYNTTLTYPKQSDWPLYDLNIEPNPKALIKANPALPVNLFLKILRQLKNPKDIATLMMLNKAFFHVYSQKTLWKNIARAHFPDQKYINHRVNVSMPEGLSWHQHVRWNFNHYYDNTKIVDKRDRRLYRSVKSSDLAQLRADHFEWRDIMRLQYKDVGGYRSLYSLYDFITTCSTQVIRNYVFFTMVLPLFPPVVSKNQLRLTIEHPHLGKKTIFQERTLLQYAAELNQIDFIKNLATRHLINNKYLNKLFCFFNGKAPVHVAAGAGHLDMVKLLVSLGADVCEGVRGVNGFTALYAAASKGHLALVEYLSETASQDLAMLVGAMHGQHKIVKALLPRVKNINITFTRRDNTALIDAACNNDFTMAEMLIKAGADPYLENYRGKSYFSHTVKNKMYRMIKLLTALPKTEMGASLATDEIILAIENNDLLMLDLLLALGADVNTDLFDEQIISGAVLFNNVEMVRLFIQAGAKTNVFVNKTQQSLLNLALSRKNVEIATLLVKAGAVSNTNDRSEKARSTLYYAVRLGNLYIVDQLLQHNNVSEAELNFLLHRATQLEHYDIVVRLLATGTKVNSTLHINCTKQALTSAIENGNLNFVQALIRGNVSVNNFDARLNPSVQAPITLAAQLGHLEIVRELINAGANIDIFCVNDARVDRPVVTALKNGHVEVAKVLIESGANLLEVGETLMRIAIEKQQYSIIDLLLEKVRLSPSELNALFLFALEKKCHLFIEKLVRSLLNRHDLQNADINPQLLARINLEKYIQKTELRCSQHGKNHYKTSFTLFCIPIHFGYSASQKLSAAKALKIHQECFLKGDYYLEKHKGALNNGELKTIYRKLIKT